MLIGSTDSVKIMLGGAGVALGIISQRRHRMILRISQYTDTESGLIYMRARYYEPVNAQFVGVDPLDAITGARYRYASSSPLNALDPSGLKCTMNNPDFPGMCVDNRQIPPATGGGSPPVDFNGCPIGPTHYQCPPPPHSSPSLCVDLWQVSDLVHTVVESGHKGEAIVKAIAGELPNIDPVIPPIPGQLVKPRRPPVA